MNLVINILSDPCQYSD